MDKIKIGIICPSEIAFRRFMPALMKCINFEYIGVSYPSAQDWDQATEASLRSEKEKAERFKSEYGGDVYEGYETLIKSDLIDAIYLPLPPSLHYKWAKLALENNKHVFLEKPSTTNSKYTRELVEIAEKKGLVLHENYMFIYHKQIDLVQELLENEVIGKTRLLRANFGFPKRDEKDFRYNRQLGGGALLDCGGYPVRLMSVLLGDKLTVESATLFYNQNDVDIYGSVQLSTQNNVAQISFGMDNSYKCDLEIWGSSGTITTNRIFTAPEGFKTEINISTNEKKETIVIDGDDSFQKSILKFLESYNDETIRRQEYQEVLTQSKLIDEIKEKSEHESNRIRN